MTTTDELDAAWRRIEDLARERGWWLPDVRRRLAALARDEQRLEGAR